MQTPGISFKPGKANYRIYFPFKDGPSENLCARAGALVEDLELWGTVDFFSNPPQSCADIFCQQDYNLVPDGLKRFASNETSLLPTRTRESIALLYSYCLYCGTFQQDYFVNTVRSFDVFHNTLLNTKQCHKYIPFISTDLYPQRNFSNSYFQKPLDNPANSAEAAHLMKYPEVKTAGCGSNTDFRVFSSISADLTECFCSKWDIIAGVCDIYGVYLLDLRYSFAPFAVLVVSVILAVIIFCSLIIPSCVVKMKKCFVSIKSKKQPPATDSTADTYAETPKKKKPPKLLSLKTPCRIFIFLACLCLVINSVFDYPRQESYSRLRVNFLRGVFAIIAENILLICCCMLLIYYSTICERALSKIVYKKLSVFYTMGLVIFVVINALLLIYSIVSAIIVVAVFDATSQASDLGSNSSLLYVWAPYQFLLSGWYILLVLAFSINAIRLYIGIKRLEKFMDTKVSFRSLRIVRFTVVINILNIFSSIYFAFLGATWFQWDVFGVFLYLFLPIVFSIVIIIKIIVISEMMYSHDDFVECYFWWLKKMLAPKNAVPETAVELK